jgi:protein-disulfide isomerase
MRLIAAGGGVVILALVVAIVVSVMSAARSTVAPTSTAPSDRLVAPANATPGGAIAIGEATAPVRLELYLDYMCPYCGRFERANSAEIERLVAAATVRLELYPLSFLDRFSAGTRYSTRAANAVVTVADREPLALLAFNRALFDAQPEEGTPGLSDDEIAARAQAAGVPQGVVDAFDERMFEPWLTASTAAVFQTGITGTPTVKINGVVFTGDLFTVGPLTEAIEAAAGR